MAQGEGHPGPSDDTLFLATDHVYDTRLLPKQEVFREGGQIGWTLGGLDCPATQCYCCVVSTLPPFVRSGSLPPGIHSTTWLEVVNRFGFNGHRRWLIEGLRKAISILMMAGAQTLYLDGSFVTGKELPDDYDACYELQGLDLKKLKGLEPTFFDFSNRRAGQKAKYRGEFFPAELTEEVSGKTFLSFFQVEKTTGEPKGIVAIDLRSFR